MTEPAFLPSDLRQVSELVGQQPVEVRELFHYALAMLLVENRKAHITHTEKRDGREYLTLETIAGEQFTIERPNAGEELLKTMRALARDVLQEKPRADSS